MSFPGCCGDFIYVDKLYDKSCQKVQIFEFSLDEQEWQADIKCSDIQSRAISNAHFHSSNKSPPKCEITRSRLLGRDCRQHKGVGESLRIVLYAAECCYLLCVSGSIV